MCLFQLSFSELLWDYDPAVVIMLGVNMVQDIISNYGHGLLSCYLSFLLIVQQKFICIQGLLLLLPKLSWCPHHWFSLQ